MTDARLAPSFLTNPKIDAMTDAAFRVYTLGLVWSVAHGTDGEIPGRALRYLHPDGPEKSVVDELVACGRWEPQSDGWRIHDFLDYQTPADVVKQLAEERKQQRAGDAERKRRQRAKPAGKSTVAADVTSDVTADVTPEIQGGHTGQDRTETETETGQARKEGTAQQGESEAERILRERWEDRLVGTMR